MSESAEGLGDSVRAHRGLGGLLRNPFTAGAILATMLFLVVYWAMGLADVGGWRGVARLGLGAWAVSVGFLYLHYHILRRDGEEAKERDGFRQLTNNVLRPKATSALAQRVQPEFSRQAAAPTRPQFAAAAAPRPQFARQVAPARPQFAAAAPTWPQSAPAAAPTRPQFAPPAAPTRRPQFAAAPAPPQPQKRGGGVSWADSAGYTPIAPMP